MGRARYLTLRRTLMARKSFALRTEPHVAEIGDDLELEFRPEIMGDEFLDAYEELREAQKALGDGTNASTEEVRAANDAVRLFLGKLMMPESAEQFAGMRLPTRVLAELVEWAVELYGGGDRPPTSSTGSAASSPPPGTSGRGASRSMGSTRTRGR